MKELVVHYSPSCAFSAATVAFLVARGAEFRMVNVELDDHRAALQRELGDRPLETPVLRLLGELIVAPPLGELKDRLLALGLPAAAAPHEKLKAAGKRESVSSRTSLSRH